jgi:hypothetical protein
MKLLGDALVLILCAGAAWAVVRTFADAYHEKHMARTPGMKQPELDEREERVAGRL